MEQTYRVGLVGARGYTGAELLAIIARHPALALAFASSREFAGRHVSEIASDYSGDLLFEALDPAAAAAKRADVVILALPDGASEPYVAALQKTTPDVVLVDLSSDYRFNDAWAYGLPELFRHRIAGKRRIANPGCYATAMQLLVAPMLEKLAGPPSLFGVSGYSGAGTTPGPRNDAERLADNLMPYALSGHKHEREVSRHLGHAVRFTPHVHPAFRGLLITAHLPLAAPLDAAALKAIFAEAYGDEPLIEIRDEPPELKEGAGRAGVVIGGFAVSEDGGHGVVVAAEDNLLKGAAVQAVQNLNLALGLDEFAALIPASPPLA